MKHVTLPCGELVSALCQGTWRIDDDHGRRQEEIDCLRRGIDLGLTLIDTAEMYGEGLSEASVGEAIEGRRDEVLRHDCVHRAGHDKEGVELKLTAQDVHDLVAECKNLVHKVDAEIVSLQELDLVKVDF